MATVPNSTTPTSPPPLALFFFKLAHRNSGAAERQTDSETWKKATGGPSISVHLNKLLTSPTATRIFRSAFKSNRQSVQQVPDQRLDRVPHRSRRLSRAKADQRAHALGETL